MRQFTQAAKVLRFETESIDLLSPLIFSAKCQLPIIKSLIVGIPGQPPAVHAVFPGRQINLRRPGHRHLIVVLVHIMGFNELMTQDELAVMDGGKCIFMLRGVRPFLSEKYDPTKHPNYPYTADADKKNLFDMERYMKRRPAIVKPDEPFELYELTADDLK